MTINEKLAELLDWSGISQGELSERTKIPPSTISSYVTGRASVSVDQAYKIAEALGVTPWTLLNMEPLPVSHMELSQAEQEFMANIRSLTNHQREIIEQSVLLMMKQNREGRP